MDFQGLRRQMRRRLSGSASASHSTRHVAGSGNKSGMVLQTLQPPEFREYFLTSDTGKATYYEEYDGYVEEIRKANVQTGGNAVPLPVKAALGGRSLQIIVGAGAIQRADGEHKPTVKNVTEDELKKWLKGDVDVVVEISDKEISRKLKNIQWKFDAKYQVATDAYLFAGSKWITDDKLEYLKSTEDGRRIDKFLRMIISNIGNVEFRDGVMQFFERNK